MRNRVLVWLRAFRADQKGLSATETGLAAALIAVTIISGASVLGPQLSNMYAIFNPHVGPLGTPYGGNSEDPSADPPEEHPDSPFVSGEEEPDTPPEPVADSGSGNDPDPAAAEPDDGQDDTADTGDKDDDDVKGKKKKKKNKSSKKH